MSDPQHQDWDAKVGAVLARIRRASLIYLTLGLVIYGCGSAIIFMSLKDNPGLATAVVMYFFQILVVIFSTTVLYPCIGGGFHVGLLANRESMPAFQELGDLIKEVKPTLARADRVGARVETAFDEGLVEEVREALQEIREFSRPKGAPSSAARGLEVLRKVKGNGEEKS